MNHEEKHVIFDFYAMNEGFDSYEDWLEHSFETLHIETFMAEIFKVCNLVQVEQQKRIAKNARSYAHDITGESFIDPTSIIDSKNIIK